jgi:APA family basic amino acid/polyamine antiporter
MTDSALLVPPATDSSARADAVTPIARRFGVPTATALVIGSVIGTRVFALPSALAPYGPISLVAFALVTVVALALALTFGVLSRRGPGGLAARTWTPGTRSGVRELLNAWSYWATGPLWSASDVFCGRGWLAIELRSTTMNPGDVP